MLRTQSKSITKRKLLAKSWTHVHIGSGNDLGRWEYFFLNDKLVLLDFDKLALMTASKPSLIDEMTKAAEDQSSSLHKFLSQHPDRSLSTQLSKGDSKRTLPPQLRAGNKSKILMLKLMTGSPSVYIPGSSVKGALRTAYLVNQLKNGKISLPDRRRNSRGDKGYLDALKRSVNAQFNEMRSPENQLFQHILIADSKVFDESKLGIAKVEAASGGASQRGNRAHSGRGGQKQQLDIYCEVLRSEMEFELEFAARVEKIDKSLIRPIETLLEIADKFYRSVWDEEKQARVGERQNQDLGDFYADQEPPEDGYLIRLGYGSGQMSTSMLVPYREKYRNEFEKYADEPLRTGPIYRKRPELLDRSPYPFTAKCALADDGYEDPVGQPMGWIVISKEVVN
ncbi:MAG: type III-A CRISPR-associated RAMP protein Csm5 [Candidatus Obscuribacterales bacterium]|nr:type III-A CRISPR-associated RAMP protein Csm5 [Candidatus Obscuribacterales bacterium]